MAYMSKNCFEQAFRDLNEARKIQPSNREIFRGLEQLNEKKKKNLAIEKAL